MNQSDAFCELNRINSGKSLGPDGLQHKLIKEMAAGIPGSVSENFNESLETGVPTENEKSAHASTIFKGDTSHLPADYHPITRQVCWLGFEEASE